MWWLLYSNVKYCPHRYREMYRILIEQMGVQASEHLKPTHPRKQDWMRSDFLTQIEFFFTIRSSGEFDDSHGVRTIRITPRIHKTFVWNCTYHSIFSTIQTSWNEAGSLAAERTVRQLSYVTASNSSSSCFFLSRCPKVGSTDCSALSTYHS